MLILEDIRIVMITFMSLRAIPVPVRPQSHIRSAQGRMGEDVCILIQDIEVCVRTL